MSEEEQNLGAGAEGEPISPEGAPDESAEIAPPQEIEIVPSDSKVARKYGSRAPFWGAAAVLALSMAPKEEANAGGNWAKDLAKAVIIQTVRQEYSAHEQRRVERKATQATEAMNAGVEIESLKGKRVLVNRPRVMVGGFGFGGSIDQEQFGLALEGVFNKAGAKTVVPWMRAQQKSYERMQARQNIDVDQSTVARPGTIKRESIEADVALDINKDTRGLRAQLGRGYSLLNNNGVNLSQEGTTAVLTVTLRNSETQESIGTIVSVGSSKDTSAFSYRSRGVQIDTRKFGDQNQANAVCAALNNFGASLERSQHSHAEQSKTVMGEIQDVDPASGRANINLGQKDGVKQYEMFGLARTKETRDPKTGATKHITYSTGFMARVKTVFEDNSEVEIFRFENGQLQPVSSAEVKNTLNYSLIPLSQTPEYQKGMRDWRNQTGGGKEKTIVAPMATRK